MSLVNRVSAFFLAALAVVLVGYSAMMYMLIREHLYHQFDARLTNGLNVLVAALEVEEDGVKWQPSDHTIELGDERREDDVRWILVDERGQVVDASTNLGRSGPIEQQLFTKAASTSNLADSFQETGHWRLIQRRLRAPHPKPSSERDLDEFAELQVTVAGRIERLRSDLFRLGVLACGLPAGLWVAAAIAGQAYCRRALKPVEEMALEAQSMTTADFDLRLPVSEAGDELSELASAFNGLLDRLQRAYVQQQHFAGDAAHQLRTPLTVLRGQIDVALRRPRSEAEYRETLVQLSQQTQELQQIVEALLFLARTEGGMALPEQQELFLLEWLPQYLTAWKDHPRSADLSLNISVETPVVSSPPLLRQALDNLIGNAMKYSSAGTPIRVHVSEQGELLEITVEDQGCGIPETELASIFEPFFRSSEARRSGVAGTGLGLAIVRQIAVALGGTVRCTSELHRGSRFTLQLPRRPEEIRTNLAD